MGTIIRDDLTGKILRSNDGYVFEYIPPPSEMYGGISRFDGTYRYHIFKTDGYLDVITGGPTEMYVIGGGGGGGSAHGGGGGAGALHYLSAYNVLIGTHDVCIGAGGFGGSSNTYSHGFNGGDSSIFGIIAKGGGGAGSYAPGEPQFRDGKDGGSGGGKSNQESNKGLALDPLYGNDGGEWGGPNEPVGSGGGGYASVGRDSSGADGGDGGDGIDLDWEGTTLGYAGGGGGGGWSGLGGISGNGKNRGGSGGPSSYTKGIDASSNSGSGGGGGTDGGTPGGGNGGSGIIMLRYPATTKNYHDVLTDENTWCWYDSSDTRTLTLDESNGVLEWRSKGRYTNTLEYNSNNNTYLPPVYDDASIGIQFDDIGGKPSYMRVNSFHQSINQVRTLYAVLVTNRPALTWPGTSWCFTQGWQDAAYWQSPNSFVQYASQNARNVEILGVTANKNTLIDGQWAAADEIGYWQIDDNATLFELTPSSNITIDALHLGTLIGQPVAYAWKGLMKEVIIRKGLDSETDKNIIRTYLKNKYSI